MAKETSHYVCQSCGATHPKWLGKCPACGSWNSLVEERTSASSAKDSGPRHQRRTGPLPVEQIGIDALPRISTGIGEFDRVLGGGAVPGGVTLVGGDPGVGKSTLLLQAMAAIAASGSKTLYVSGEESASQTAQRARRLNLPTASLYVHATSSLEDALKAVADLRPTAMVLDSVQTLRSATLEAAQGTISQLREVTSRLVDVAQAYDVATFLVGHVTKDGVLAGPKVLEHLVDTVLGFEGDRGHAFRTLRTQKNRFGSATEVGLFEMTADGMREVTQPSASLLSERPTQASGSVVAATSEGARALLVEVQALVGSPVAGSPRRTTTGVDGGRLAMLLAVLERRVGLNASVCDVFVNVAGGLRIDEPALDLAVALAVASSLTDRCFFFDTAVFGEIGLTGEVRAVPRMAARLAEASAMGFRRVLLPASGADRITSDERRGLELVAVTNLQQAVDFL